MTDSSAPAPQQWRQAVGKTLRRGLAAAVAAVLVAGCASAPPTVRLHSLLGSTAGISAATQAAAVGAPIRLVIAPVTVPAAVDQPQWLVRRADDSLQMLEEDRWAAPLADEWRMALRALLASRWNIVDGSLPRGIDAPAAPAWRLVVEVLRMDATPGVATQLDARWILLGPQAAAPVLRCDTHVVEPVRGSGTVPLAEAWRRSVVRLADQIGERLRAAASGNSGAACAEPVRS